MYRKFCLVLLLLVSTTLLAPPPNTIDPQTVATGDIIGVSSRREVSGFMVQAFTHSPIDHVGIVTKDAEGTFVWHLTRTGSGKIPLAEFIEKYRAGDGQLYFAVGRVTPPLTDTQKNDLSLRVANAPAPTGQAPICSEYVAQAFQSIGVPLGERSPLGDPTTNRLAGFMAQHWNKFFAGHTSSIPSSSLFAGRARVIAANIPLTWTDGEQLEAWEKTGDVSKVARIYFPDRRVDGPHETSAISQDFFTAQRLKLVEPTAKCRFQDLRTFPLKKAG